MDENTKLEIKKPFDKLQHFPDHNCIDNIDHPSHARPGIHPFPDRLYVVTTVFNPLRFRNRYWNYWTFENMVDKAGAILYTVEIAFGDRHFEITDPDNPHHLQLRARENQEIWLKENSLNLLINRLPPEAKYIAWIDSDLNFARPDWAQETLHLLQHYYFLQMFSHAQDIGPNYEPIVTTPGYIYAKYEQLDNNFNDSIGKDCNNTTTNDNDVTNHYYYGVEKKLGKEVGWKYRHPGFCWAARREALNWVGGLIDWTILGSGDWIMACALMEEVRNTINSGYSETYKNLCYTWEGRCKKYIRRNVGYMPGTVYHSWHGKKINRNYDRRWGLLVETKYDPLVDLKRDVQGLYQLVDTGEERSIILRDGLRRYAKMRREDDMEK